MADTESERRTILEAVADGSLSPAEAAERLAALDERDVRTATGGPSRTQVRRVRIVSTGQPVRVTAQAGLAEPAIEGPHTARREGDTLVIQAEADDGNDFFIAAVPPWQHRADPLHKMWRGAPPLVVRMPPDLALEAEVTATSLAVRDVKGPLTLNVSAGSAKVAGFASPIDVEVTAGSFTATGVLDRGESTVRCNAGSVKLHLGRTSSVRIKGAANAGRLSFPFARYAGLRGPNAAAGVRGGPIHGPRGGPFVPFGEERETVIGDGAGSLDIEVTTGSVAVRADS